MRRRVWSAVVDDARAGGGELVVELGVVQRDGELPGDEHDGVEPVGGERAADEPVLQQQHRPQLAAAEDRHGQQRAAGRGRRSRGRGRTGRRRWRRPRPAVPGCAGRSAPPTSAPARSRPVPLTGTVPPARPRAAASRGVLVPQQQVDAGGAGHRAEHLDDPGVQAVDAGLRAQRLGGGQDAEQVDRAGRDARALRWRRQRAGRRRSGGGVGRGRRVG